MQLFSIGLALQNDDGTLKLDDDGNEIATYTNFDISEYAKVYVGLRDQLRRGNIETRINEIDPLRIETSWKDKFPKVCFYFFRHGDRSGTHEIQSFFSVQGDSLFLFSLFFHFSSDSIHSLSGMVIPYALIFLSSTSWRKELRIEF